LWNETRAAGLHYFIEPLSNLNSIDFVKRIFRPGRREQGLSAFVTRERQRLRRPRGLKLGCKRVFVLEALQTLG
jgi:hypothetical protein